MTVSLSPCFRVFVCSSPFFLLVSLESVVDLKCYKQSKSVKVIQWESICVSRVLQVSLEGVSKKFLGSFKEVSTLFQLCLEGVSWKF